ncbi:uncharacterized protein B0H64DRAFT_375093 [Chaetomium fimeti]|uniref:Uncharacterized protein n=1 Tax=Chaetomium fimeti TaxID=1854472 RepID=A0AAE0HD33_9PEZI|nr:hypothetical protein B0H64DRAFT_375093 [Chaetomium fimeti]
MSDLNNLPARDEQHQQQQHQHDDTDTTNPARHADGMRGAMDHIAQEVAYIDQTITDVLRDPNLDVLRLAAARIAFALRLLGGDLGRLLARHDDLVRGGEDAAAGGPSASSAGAVEPVFSSSPAAVAVDGGCAGGAAAGGVGARGSGAGGSVPGGSPARAAAAAAAATAAGGVCGPDPPGAVGSGAGSADGDSIGDDSTVVASSDGGSANAGPADNDPVARGSPSATVDPIDIPRAGNPSRRPRPNNWNGYYIR